MKELKLEELSTRQKLGMTFTAFLNGYARTPEEDAFIVDMIKNHSLGCVWIQEGREGVEELVSMVKEDIKTVCFIRISVLWKRICLTVL